MCPSDNAAPPMRQMRFSDLALGEVKRLFHVCVLHFAPPFISRFSIFRKSVTFSRPGNCS